MKKIAPWLICLALAGCGPAVVNNPNDYDQKERPEQEDVADGVEWSGPGWYYGVYFDTPADFVYWRRRHPQRYHRHGRYYGPYHRGSQRGYHHHRDGRGGRRHGGGRGRGRR